MPCSPDVWEAVTAAERWDAQFHEEQPASTSQSRANVIVATAESGAWTVKPATANFLAEMADRLAISQPPLNLFRIRSDIINVVRNSKCRNREMFKQARGTTLALLASVATISVITTDTAHAKLKLCTFTAHDLHGRQVADGQAWGTNKRRVCKRARRRCDRELRRKQRQGKVGRARCTAVPSKGISPH